MADALDKRIRAVYDAFDVRNYKAAIKLSNAGLQKYPDCHVFRSLKAVALERTGKPEEALQVAEQVLAASPPDDHVLNLLLLVLKPANRTGDLLPAYQAACSKDPGNQELAVGLFACHTRAFAFREQQAQAMKLNKAFPCELYQWWVVCSLALQAHAAAATAQLAAAQEPATAGPATAAGGGGGSGLGVPQLLQLAEAMAARLLAKTGSSSSWEAVMLYLGLLQAQGKYDAALEALRGPLGGAISLAAERREAEAALLLGQGQLGAAAALYEAALAEQPDDWAVLLLYLDCLLPGTAASLPASSSTAVAQMLAGAEASTRPAGFMAAGLPALLAAAATAGEPASPSLQDRLEQAAAFINSLPATAPPAAAASDATSNAAGAGGSEGSGAKAPALLRGPALARVELIKRRLQLGQAQQQELVDALLQHHDKFGHVVSCAVDVYCYLALLDAAARQSLGQQLNARAEQAAEQLRQQCGEISPKDAAAQVKLLRRQMSALQIQADLGLPSFPDAASAQAHALSLLQQYASVALPLQAALSLDERERGPADELLWLAAAALMAAAALAQQQQHQEACDDMQQPMAFILQALLVLEAAGAGRPYCARVQLGLTGLHGLLSNARVARLRFGQLDVKHIQHDTLSGQHLVPLLLGLRAVPAARELLAASAALFEDHLRDAGDTLMQAHKHGTHTKVLEFVCFKERLERSHTWVITRAEAALLSITTAAAGREPAAADAVAAAAHAAAAKLPLQLLDSCDWRGMRFNDDLTTRLPWLPPIAGPRHLAVLVWWEQQQHHGQQQQQQQQQQCWWRCVSAAEADLPEAAALRAAMRAAAQQRWLLPHLLDAALHAGAAAGIGSSSGGGAAAASQLDHPQQQPQHMLKLLDSYASALGAADAAALELRVDSWLSSSSSGLAFSQQLQLLDGALFTLAGSVQDLLAAAGHEEAEPAAAAAASLVPRAARLASALQQLQQCLLPQLLPSAAFLGRLLPGAALSAAALLVEEGCCWAACCLEAWSRAVSKARRRAKPKKPAAAAAAPVLQQPGVQAALEQLQAVQAALSGLLSAVADAVQQLLAAAPAGREAAAVLLTAFDPASNSLVQGLVGWEGRLSVESVVTDTVLAQRELLQQVAGSATKLGKRIDGLAW